MFPIVPVTAFVFNALLLVYVLAGLPFDFAFQLLAFAAAYTAILYIYELLDDCDILGRGK